MAHQPMSKDGVQHAVESILEILILLGQGDTTAEELRDRARSLALSENQIETAIAWIDLAEMLHVCEKESTKASVTVVNPRYRKGTGRQPATWSSCLWKPPGVCS